mmetsp:Transcript_8751/g.14207  ORF Transcript_8751/g.14207 Transcript_8751/m.14207 type:complete len:263 (+) Transcript_8751:300-1088(+)
MGKYVANNTFLSRDSNLNIITGPNNGGKSTYLLQVAVMTVIAHLGCYVPAEYASIRLTDQIFALIVMQDEIESNSSTFMAEMRQLAYILQNSNSKSLIIIDELGRGTSTLEGFSICWATCEELLQSGAYTLFATHFLKLTQLPFLYNCVKNIHFQVISNEEDKAIIFVHELKNGPSGELDQRYGIHIAKISGFPAKIIKTANKIYTSLIRIESKRICSDKSLAIETNDDELIKSILACKYSSLSEEVLHDHLLMLAKKYGKM